MTQRNRAIVPQPTQQIAPLPPGAIASQQPQVITPISQRRPSHYIPVVLRSDRPDNGLFEVAQVFVYGGLIFFGLAMIAMSVIHFGNAVYWQGERMHQRVQPGYLGGTWNE
ncbi:MAG: hypothetical protein AAF959_10810 [Cyanobacteria bacterium P01_D01_bin.56]